MIIRNNNKHDDSVTLKELIEANHEMLPYDERVQGWELNELKLNEDIIIAELEGEEKVIGFAWLKRVKGCKINHNFEIVICVAEGYRRENVATQLLDECKKRAKLRAPHPKLIMHVTMDNIPAIVCYLKNEFRFESVDRGGFDGKDQYIMSWGII